MKTKANISCLSSGFLTLKDTIHKAWWKAKGVTAAKSGKEYSLMRRRWGKEREQNKTMAVSLDCIAYDTIWYVGLGCKMHQYGMNMDLWGYFQRTLARKMSVWEFQNSRLPPALGLAFAQFHTLFHNDLQIILSKRLVHVERSCPNPGPQAFNSMGRVLTATWLSRVFTARNRTEAKYKELVNMLPFISHIQLVWASHLLERYWSVTPTKAIILRSHTHANMSSPG